MEMRAGDLVMLVGDAILYDPKSPQYPIFGNIGDVVTVINAPNEFGVATVLHPVHGLCEIYDHSIHPITGVTSEG